MPSVMQMARSISASTASQIAAAAPAGAKIGMPSKSSPAFFGFTPATKAALPFA
eukprot:gene18382-21993_t